MDDWNASARARPVTPHRAPHHPSPMTAALTPPAPSWMTSGRLHPRRAHARSGTRCERPSARDRSRSRSPIRDKAAATRRLRLSMRTRTPGVPRSHGTRCCIGLAARIDVARERGAGLRAAAVVGAAPDAWLLTREHAGCVSDVRGGVMSELLLDAAGRRRSPVTLPGFHVGRPPRNKGMRYPADPPTIEEIVSVMRRAGDGVHGHRLRGLMVVLWRAGLADL